MLGQPSQVIMLLREWSRGARSRPQALAVSTRAESREGHSVSANTQKNAST